MKCPFCLHVCILVYKCGCLALAWSIKWPAAEISLDALQAMSMLEASYGEQYVHSNLFCYQSLTNTEHKVNNRTEQGFQNFK